MFVYLLNDIPDEMQNESEILVYADDILVFSLVDTDEDVAKLQQDLENLSLWASAHQKLFNAQKSVFVRFSQKRSG